MIPKHTRPGATAEGLYGETVQFTIKANGKAFRSLIDTLYTNKVLAAVRELCSNAHDAHIEAGQTCPFQVNIPTPLDPMFSIRDFGIGMDHDQVMHLYTTIFESSKEDSNEYTGQLGLGSKAPFAYTDSFSVISYTGTEKRIYLTFLGTDGIPSMTHVDTVPCDEPRGIEVSFAAKRESIPEFQKEMRFVSLGYDTPPIVTGMNLDLPQPQMTGTNWAIYPSEEFEGADLPTNHYIRMGSALYPSNRDFPHVSYDYVTITTIPIGMAMVTSSRDALSYDHETAAAVRQIHDAAYGELYAQMEADVARAKTRREQAATWLKYSGVLNNLGGKTTVSLRNNDFLAPDDEEDTDSPNMWSSQPGDVLQQGIHYGKSQNARRTYGRYVSALEVKLLDKMTLIVDDSFNRTVRRKVRIQNAAKTTQGATYVFSAIDRKHMEAGLAWITECFELRDDQIVMVGDLTDYPPERKVRADGTPAARSGPRRLGPNQYWLIKNGGIAESEIYGNAWGKGMWPGSLQTAMGNAGLSLFFDDVFWVNDRQFDAMRKRRGNLLPKARRLDVAVQRMIASKARRAPTDQALEYTALSNIMGDCGSNNYGNNTLEIVLDLFFPHIKITADAAFEALTVARAAGITLQSREVRDKVQAQIDELSLQYPLLFGDRGRQSYIQYIHAINLKETATP